MKKCIGITLLTFLLLLYSLSFGGGSRIIILPFESISQEDLSFIQGVVPKLLSTRIAEITGLETEVSDVSTLDEALAKYGPAYLVTGSITRLGGAYSLDIRLHDRSGDKMGGFFSSAKDENAIIASLEDLAKDVAGALPEGEAAREGLEQEEAGVEVSAGEVAAPHVSAEKPGKEVIEEKVEEAVPLQETVETTEEIKVAEKAVEGSVTVSAKKGGFTEIVNVRTLGKLPGEIYRVASADMDGDGNIEFAFMGKQKIFLYRFEGGVIKPVDTFERGGDHHFLNIDTFDVDGDGLDDFVVTDLLSEFLRSFVIGKKNGGIAIKIDDIGWYLAVFDDFRGERVLVGQKVGVQRPYRDSAYLLTWNGKGFSEGEKIRVPVNEEMVMGVLDMNSFVDEEEQRFVLLDQYEKIRAADDEGKIFWKSGDYYSGAYDFFYMPSESIGADGELRRYYVKSRSKKISHDDKILFLVRKAPKPLLRDVRHYSKSRLVLLEWDGDGFAPKNEGKELSNLITDFSIFDMENGDRMIISSVILKKESGFSRGSTRVELFALK